MPLDLTDHPDAADEAFVIEQTRAYNRRFTPRDVQPLCVFARDDDGQIIGGLAAETYWQYLDISFLWVDERHRKSGYIEWGRLTEMAGEHERYFFRKRL